VSLFFSPYNYEFHNDPYPLYARLRAEAPVYRNGELDFWALSRYSDVAAAFGDFETFSSANGIMIEPSVWGPEAWKFISFLAMDPPRHTRMRGLISQAFTPRRVAALEPRIREIAGNYLDAAMESSSFDFVADLAAPLPMDVISELMGVPEADRPEVRRLVDQGLHREKGMRDIPPAAMEAGLVLSEYYLGLLAARRRAPAADLISALVDVDTVGARLTDEDLVAVLFLLVGAGSETITHLLGSAWYWAWRNPAQRAAAFDGNITGWIDETLRYDTPAQIVARTAARDLDLHGVRIRAGARILLLAGSANRDDLAFPSPDSYDLGRDTSKHINFGNGRHFCLGAALGRLEARVTLEQLVARVRPGYEIDPARVSRVHSANVRGFASLPTSVTPRLPGQMKQVPLSGRGHLLAARPSPLPRDANPHEQLMGALGSRVGRW
jgi:cytochrome P450